MYTEIILAAGELAELTRQANQAGESDTAWIIGAAVVALIIVGGIAYATRKKPDESSIRGGKLSDLHQGDQFVNPVDETYDQAVQELIKADPNTPESYQAHNTLLRIDEVGGKEYTYEDSLSARQRYLEHNSQISSEYEEEQKLRRFREDIRNKETREYYRRLGIGCAVAGLVIIAGTAYLLSR